jgi:nucleotide-binding universal stress UspA family protein
MTAPHRTILVPLDGSDFAERALAPALALATRSGGTLHLVSAVSTFPIFQPSDRYRDETPGWFAEEGVRTQGYLQKVKARIVADAPGQAVEIHAPAGRPAARILQAIKDLDADLIVMSTHGRGALARLWVGSVADQVMREATCPVLLIPSAERVEFSTSILVPMDGSEGAEAALDEAVRLATLWESRLTLATVIPRPQSVAVPYLDLSAETERMRMDREEEMRTYLEKMAAPLQGEGLRVDTMTSRADEVAPGLVRLAEQSRSGLVVMGTQGRGGVARLLLGSVAARMVRSSTIPVLLVPPRVQE